MNFIDRLMGRKEQSAAPEPVRKSFDIRTMVMNFSQAEKPSFKQSRRGDYVQYGSKNDFPQQLFNYMENSAIHNGIINGKSYQVAGGEFLIDGVVLPEWVKSSSTPVNEAAQVSAFLNNTYGQSWAVLKSRLATAWEIGGAMAVKVIWANDFSHIASVQYCPWQNLRAVEDDDGELIGWKYSRDWSNSRITPENFQMFDMDSQLIDGKMPDSYEGDLNNHPFDNHQILYVGNPFGDWKHYGRPCYIGALTAIKASGMLSDSYLSSIENGFTPSVVWKYMEEPGSVAEGFAATQELHKQFTGKGVGRKLIVNFAKSRELSPDIIPLDVKNIDAQMFELNNQLNSQIITAHSVTAPELVGVAVPGFLGNGSFEEKAKLFKATVIDRDKAVIEGIINELASVNGITQKITISDHKLY